MRISVIIPCHNAGRWISTALQSVACQTFGPHEVIVIDDSSTDDSVERIKTCNAVTHLLRTDTRNAAVARNRGIEAASGDWVAFLDADDVWYPNHLDRARHLLQRSQDVAFMANHDWIGHGGGAMEIPLEHRCKLASPGKRLSHHRFFEIVQQGFHFGHSTVLYRRSRALEVGLFDATQKRRHDIDLWLRVVCDRTWTYDTDKCAGYRVDTPGSISKHRIECDYYYLRALSKNLDGFNDRSMRRHLQRSARRAMGIAFTDASPLEYLQIRAAAWPYLTPFYRFFYTLSACCPKLLRQMVQIKRQVSRRAVLAYVTR